MWMSALRQYGREFANRLQRDTRSRQLNQEVQFWRDWLSTRGLQWPEDYEERLDPKFAIQDHVARFIERVPGNSVAVLDIGAGPLTKLGKVHPIKELRITATDLLAHQYSQLLLEFGVCPLIPTVFADVENLTDYFAESSFDIVHAQNCIDHTENPLRAIQQMILATKPTGYVILLHCEKEGETNCYTQLHKWDFLLKNGDFMIKGPGPRGAMLNASEALAPLGLVECTYYSADILVTICRNRPEPQA
jgi:SAM-dependent methyltransferase